MIISSYAWTILWYERQRFLAAMFAVSFSTLLIALQCGLLLGMFQFASLPVDHALNADVWVGAPNLVSVDLGKPIPESSLAFLANQPQIKRCEIFLQGFARWGKPDGGSELSMIIGTRLEDNSLGAMAELTPDMRAQLSEPGTIVMDESDLAKLGINGVGDFAYIADQRIRVVGIVHGFRGMAGAYVFCSVETARLLLRMRVGQTVYVLGQCYDPAEASTVVRNMRASFPELSVFTSEQLSIRSRIHWLIKTKAGLALGYAALLGLLVGAVVTSQTLYGATAASLREYAVLWALGIPMRQMGALVITQSFWIGVAGVVVAMPMIFVLSYAADWLDLTVSLPYWLLLGSAAVTLSMTLISGLMALRLLWTMEPAVLLR